MEMFSLKKTMCIIGQKLDQIKYGGAGLMLYLVAQSCLTLCNPMDCSLPGSSVHEILQARILEWVTIPLSRGVFLTQGLNPGLSHYRQILYHLSY